MYNCPTALGVAARPLVTSSVVSVYESLNFTWPRFVDEAIVEGCVYAWFELVFASVWTSDSAYAVGTTGTLLLVEALQVVASVMNTRPGTLVEALFDNQAAYARLDAVVASVLTRLTAYGVAAKGVPNPAFTVLLLMASIK